MAKYIVRVARSAGLIILFVVAAMLGIASGVLNMAEPARRTQSDDCCDAIEMP